MPTFEFKLDPEIGEALDQVVNEKVEEIFIDAFTTMGESLPKRFENMPDINVSPSESSKEVIRKALETGYRIAILDMSDLLGMNAEDEETKPQPTISRKFRSKKHRSKKHG